MTLKSWAITGFMALSFIAGALGQYLYPGKDYPPTDLWLLPAFTLLIFLWYRADTEQKAIKRSPWLNISIIALAVLALPIYFFRTRGFKGGLIATIGMLAYLFLSGALTGLGQYAIDYGLQS